MKLEVSSLPAEQYVYSDCRLMSLHIGSLSNQNPYLPWSGMPMKLYSPCHLKELLGHSEFVKGGSVLAAQSAVALPIGSVFGLPRSELLVFKWSRSRNESVCIAAK